MEGAEFSRAFAATCARHRLSHRVVADACGLSRLSVGKIVRGDVVPRARTRERIAAALAARGWPVIPAPRPISAWLCRRGRCERVGMGPGEGRG